MTLADQERPQQSPDVAPVDITPALAVLEVARKISADPSTEEPSLEVPSPEMWKAVPVLQLREDLDALIVQRGVEESLDYLQRMGCIAVWFPELEAMIGMSDGEWRHKDVWKHTKQVVRQSVPRLEVRWGALLHDIGKPRTRHIDERGRVTFYGHAELGARMFRRNTARRLRFKGDLKNRIHFLILHHLRPGQYEAGWTDAAVRRFYKQMGEGLRDLLDLGRADITTKRPEKRRRGVRNISDLGKRIKDLRTEDEKPKALPKGLGQHVMERFGIPPSKRLGNIIKALTEDVETGKVESLAEFEVYLEYLAANAERFGIE